MGGLPTALTGDAVPGRCATPRSGTTQCGGRPPPAEREADRADPPTSPTERPSSFSLAGCRPAARVPLRAVGSLRHPSTVLGSTATTFASNCSMPRVDSRKTRRSPSRPPNGPAPSPRSRSARSVVCDDTLLDPQHLSSWIEFLAPLGVAIIIVDVPTPVDECIRRDRERGAAGGRQVGGRRSSACSPTRSATPPLCDWHAADLREPVVANPAHIISGNTAQGQSSRKD